MQTGGNSTDSGTGSGIGSGQGKAVLVAILVPLGQTMHGGLKPAAKTPAAAMQTPSSQQRVADAMRKAAQSSQAAQAALRRNPAAVARIGAHARTLAANPARSPLAALKHGLGVSGGLGSLRRDMRKDFRKGGGEVKTASSHGLSERGQRHAAAAERGLRRGGLGLLSAAWHGTRIMREQRKTLNRERADARAEARAAGKPMPPEGMRALLGAAVKGVGIARGLRAGLSEMQAQERARSTQTPSPGPGRAGAATHAGTTRTGLAIADSPWRRNQEVAHGAATDLHAGHQTGHGTGPRVLRATGFALGAMALGHADGGGGGSGHRTGAGHVLGLALWMPQAHAAADDGEGAA